MMMATPDDRRVQSLAAVRALGYREPPAHLPLGEDDEALRAPRAVAARMLVLHALVAVGFGFPPARARAWVEANGLAGELTGEEAAYLADPQGPGYKSRLESIAALAWALGLIEALPFDRYAPDELARRLPNLMKDEPAEPVLAAARLRGREEIAALEDLAYCLHWAVTQQRQDGKPDAGPLWDYAIVNRRWALSWLLSDEAWDEVSLDT